MPQANAASANPVTAVANGYANRVIVIGAGISGLSCAHRLKQLGGEVVLLEAASSAGGLISTEIKDGFLFESGPQSFQGTEPLLELIRQLGIERELQTADPRAPRYILRGGRLRKLPMSPPALLTSSFLSMSSRWKIVSELFRRTHPPAHEESVADFARRKFGDEILEYLVSPFVSGIYAGDPERLSLRAAFPSLEEWERQFGSVLRGAMKSRPPKEKRTGPQPLCSFRGGLATLIKALEKSLGASIRLGARVVSITRTPEAGGDGYEVRVSQNGKNETLAARAVVIATPTYIASQLVQPISPALTQALSGITYAPVAVAAAGYDAKQFARPLIGFGFFGRLNEASVLLGRREPFRRTFLGCHIYLAD